MNLLKIVHVPAVEVSPDSTVIEAIEASAPARVGAVAVMETGLLVGVFTVPAAGSWRLAILGSTVSGRSIPTMRKHAPATRPCITWRPQSSAGARSALFTDKPLKCG